MKKTIYLFALAGLTVAACGDNLKSATNDGHPGMDGSGSNSFPAAPTLGAQIDRMGRPAISTALIDPFLPPSASGSDKDAYNQDANVPMWQQTWVPTFLLPLAAIDSLDTGFCGNGFCETAFSGTAGVPETNVTCPVDCPLQNAIVTADGCGNVPFYAPGSAGPTSYVTLAGLLADDELYVNTAKGTCNAYLGVEFNYATGVDVPSCGGRAPSYDVMDYSYSMLMAGLFGFDTATLQPKFHDDPAACRAGSAANDPTCANHPPAGTSDTDFPFLAAPH